MKQKMMIAMRLALHSKIRIKSATAVAKAATSAHTATREVLLQGRSGMLTRPCNTCRTVTTKTTPIKMMTMMMTDKTTINPSSPIHPPQAEIAGVDRIETEAKAEAEAKAVEEIQAIPAGVVFRNKRLVDFKKK
jgi:hypothetical protein